MIFHPNYYAYVVARLQWLLKGLIYMLVALGASVCSVQKQIAADA